MRKRRLTGCRAAAAALLLTAALSADVRGLDTDNLPNYVENDTLLIYMPTEEYTGSEVRVQVGSSAVLKGRLRDIEGNGCIQTLILFDNSLSVSTANRERMKNVIRTVAERQSPGEQFAFATFDTDVHLMTEMTSDADAVLQAVEDVKFENQYTWTNDCLYSCIGDSSLFSPGAFARILICGDGSNDNPAGYTEEEVRRRLQQYSCRLLAVGSLYSGDPKAAARLLSMARSEELAAWLLDNYGDDLTEVTEGICRERPAKVAVVPLEEKLLDGSEKRVQVQVPVRDGTFCGAAAVRMPFSRTVPEETPAPTPTPPVTPTPEVTPVPTPVSTPVPTPTPIPTPKAAPSPIPEPRQAFSFPVYLLPVPAAAAVLLLAAVIRKRAENRKTHEPDIFPDDDMSAGRSWLEEDAAGGYEEQTVYSPADNEATVVMMDGEAVLHAADRGVCMLTLRSEDGRQEAFTVPVTSEVVIGRNPDCTIPLTGDRTVSAHHCVIYRVGDDLMLRDNDSANGTWLNRQRITGPQKTENGDIIGIGRRNWIVSIRFEPQRSVPRF